MRTAAGAGHGETGMQTTQRGCEGSRQESSVQDRPNQMTENRRNEKMKKVWIGLLIVALTAGFAFAQAKGTPKEA